MKKHFEKYFQKFQENQSFSTRMTAIYLLLFVFFVALISVASYWNSSVQMEKEVNVFADSLLSQTKMTIDKQLKSIDDTIVTLLGSDKNVRMFASDSYTSKNEYINSQIELQETLRFIQETSPYIHSIYIYSEKNGNLITADSKMREEEQFDTAWKELSQGKALVWLGTRELPADIYDTNPVDVITVVRQYPFTLNTERSEGRVAVNIDASILDDVMDYENGEANDKLVVCGENGEIILSSKELAEKDAAYWNDLYSRASGEKITEKIDGANYLVYTQQSESLNWKYLYLAEKKQIYAPLTQMRNISIFMAILILLFAFAANIYLREFTYKPLDKFLRSVVDAVRPTQPGKEIRTDNVQEIEMLFSRMFHEHQRMQSQVQDSIPALKWRILTDIILGYRDDIAEIQSQLQSLKISLGNENFIVMVAQADEGAFARFAEPEKHTSLYRTSLVAMAEEEINGESAGAAFELTNGNICILISFESYDPVKNSAVALSYAEAIRMKSQDNFNVPLTVGIGRLKKEAREIKTSFREATDALEYQIVIGNGAIIQIEDVESYDERGLYGFLSSINEIAQSLKTVGESEEYKQNIIKLYDRFKQEKLSPQMIVQMSVQLIMQSIYVVVDLGIPIQKLLGEQYSNMYDILVDFASFEELRDYVISIIECFVENIRLKRTSRNINEKTIERVLEFINQNYGDRKLSLNMLAEEFHFSAPYLSKLFKQTTETNFLDYLINLRVKKAQEMLLHTNLSINEIAERVGYPTYHSFMQIFKKYTGVTPSEYRSTMGKAF